jgi:glycine/D-amino acid oxidase-like deaminating enzyme
MPSDGVPARSQASPRRSVVVIGSGLVGLSCAWLLARRGHAVLLLDGSEPARPPSDGDPPGERGSEAALGVLMARVFHRSSGRGWRLRQRSLELWGAWRRELAACGLPIPWRPGLLLLAADASDLIRQQLLLRDPRRQHGDEGQGLQHWDPQRLRQLDPLVPAAALGGLYSPQDGQLDPRAAMDALARDAAAAGMERRSERVAALEQCSSGWRLRLSSGASLKSEWLVLAAGLGSTALLPAGLQPPPPRLEPVLGQALELELDPRDRPADAGAWPGAVVWRGINLIQRPPATVSAAAAAPWRLWLGATLEPGQEASTGALESLRDLAGDAPAWLRRARVCRQWQGLRARPQGQPAPLLQDLGGGLLLAAGHYRNGVLLGPVSAEWVAERIAAGRDAT